MHEQKIQNLLKLSNEDRYWFSTREIIKLEKVWAIASPDFWVTFVDHENEEVFPIWPSKELAEKCIFEELKVKDYTIESIKYEDFKNMCLQDMRESKILFGVFYNKDKEAVVVNSDDLENDLVEAENR